MRLICSNCKTPMETTYLTALVQCVESVWNSESIRRLNLTDELKKDLAVSLFISVGKDAITTKIQQGKR